MLTKCENSLGAENLWFCMACGEYLRDHPTNIQNICFDHMCTDLQKANVSERINEVIAVLELAKSKFHKSSPEVEPDSIWGWFKKSISRKVAKVRSPRCCGLIFQLFIFVLDCNVVLVHRLKIFVIVVQYV